jgi:hypothetical protein
MNETNGTGKRSIEESLRWASNFCCLWRACANAKCRRARCCRGRAHDCGRRNSGLVPPLVREFFICVLAAKRAGVSFDDLRSQMEGTEEASAYFAWREAARDARR